MLFRPEEWTSHERATLRQELDYLEPFLQPQTKEALLEMIIHPGNMESAQNAGRELLALLHMHTPVDQERT
jgi:hypothetical protein